MVAREFAPFRLSGGSGMRRLLLLIPFIATTLLSQWSDPHVRAETRDGQELVFEVAEPAVISGVIVEFRDPPLCLLRNRSAKSAMADYRAAFTRFRQDTASISKQIRYEYFEAFNGVSLTVSEAEVPKLRQLPYVKAVYPDTPVHALAATPGDNITRIGADRVWSSLGSRGAGVVVAIIDTGIDYTHPALGGGIGRGFKVIGGYDFVNKDADPMDDNLHGTHVAGIVAGNSDDLVGVAPDASLLAYKVLNAFGSGTTSDVLAGIERAVDPNGDGDLSDHADVGNMSLGGTGNPDDALSQAVDNATAAGMVFCIAAGNEGDFHRIGSPGTSRSAITVGATDNTDHIAPFSSRGPNTKDAAIKPDVLAPGVSIRSSLPGGTYGPLSGTSMATPHVAGVAALLKSLHHDWTPGQVKSAIVNSAAYLAEEVMSQGGGRVDALRAAGSTLFIEPSTLSLGGDHIRQQIWSSSATFRLTNRGSQPALYTVSAPSGLGVSTSITPSSVAVDPDGSADVTVSFDVTNAVALPGLSLAIGSIVSVTNTATKEVVHVPWAAMKAAHTIVSYDKPFPVAYLIDRAAGRLTPAIPMSNTELEAWLRAGSYDLLLTWSQIDPASFAPGGSIHLNDLRVHYNDALAVNDDITLAVNTAQASHTITFDGRDENAAPLVAGSDFSGYASTGRLVLPQGGSIISLRLPPFSTRTWHVSDISEKLLLHELNYRRGDGHFYAVQHPPLVGVHDDATLTTGGSALRGASARIVSPPAQSSGDQRVIIIVQQLAPLRDSSGALSLTLRPASYIVEIPFFLSPNVDPDYSVCGLLESVADFSFKFVTPQLRILNDRLVASNTLQPPSWIYDGDGLIFGNGVVFPTQTYSASIAPLKPTLFTDFVGQLGEVRVGERSSTVTTIFAADSSVQGRFSSPVPLDLSQAGPFTIQTVDTGVLVPGVPRKSTVTMTIDSSRSDFYPPTFTAMMLFDANGRIAPRLEPHGGGSLVFAAADYVYPATGSRTYQPVAADQTKAWYRYRGSDRWQPLTATQVTEDKTAGILFHVDLQGVTAIDHGLVDMKFDIADAAGNTTSFVMEPAFSVGRDSWLGREGPRR
jgi:hypothetical protein